jgi:PAS domain-containing protein
VTEPFKDIENARALAQAIVDTVREPLLVLDGDLRVLAVSRSFYLTFRVQRQDVLGRPLYMLGEALSHSPSIGDF